MDNIKDTKYYLNLIVEDIGFCITKLNNMDLQDFCNDEVLFSAISFKFIQISENVKKLPKSLLEAYPNIPWNKIGGLRNRIVHDYGSVQLDIIYDAIKNDLPDLLDALNECI